MRGMPLLVSCCALCASIMAFASNAPQNPAEQVQPRLKQLDCAASPIVVPLDSGTPRTFSPGVVFDLKGDGHPDRLSWPENPSQVAFLAIDRDGDGRITSAKELFTE